MRYLLEPHSSAVNSRHVRSIVGKSHARSLQFHLVSTWIQLISSPSQSCCLELSFGFSINTFSRGSFSTSQSLLSNQTWVSSTSRGRRFTFWVLPPRPIQRVGSKDRATLELIRGLGYSGSSLLFWLSLSSANLL